MNVGVYTAMFGAYDTIRKPQCKCANDFVLFTDQNVLPDGWIVKKINPHPNPSYASRYCFDQSCLLMPDYDATVMHGGNSVITMPPDEIIKKYLPDGFDLACFVHPHREDVFQEAKACISFRKDKAEVINPQIERYRAEGFDESIRLSTAIILIRRNTERMRAFEDYWWNEVENGSCRDQLSFDYARWKLDFPIAIIPGTPYGTKIFKVGKHTNGRKPNEARTKGRMINR